jgi:superfamily II DNA or RNA helicase
LLQAWNSYVSSSTISNCFYKATFFSRPLIPETTIPRAIDNTNISELYDQVKQAGAITDAMELTDFLNPAEETEVEVQHTQTEKQIMDEVIQEFIEESTGLCDSQDDDDTEQQLEQPVYTIQAAREALQVLIDFTETRDDLNTSYLRAMERLEGDLELLLVLSRRQRTLDE